MKDLVKIKNKLLQELKLNSNFVRGSLNSVCAKCNRANCICEKEHPKKAYRLTYKDSLQKTQIVYIPEKKIPKIEEMIDNYAKARAIMEELIEVNLEIFKNKDTC